jgi:hypothetical protein
MDILNDLYPLHERNPENFGLSETEINEKREYAYRLRSRKRKLDFEDFCVVHSDDLWYLWCIIKEFSVNSRSFLLDELDYHTFCMTCYNNTK